MPTYICNVDCRGNVGYGNYVYTNDFVSELHNRSTTYSNIVYPNQVGVGNNSNNNATNIYNYFSPASSSNKTSSPDTWVSTQWNVRFDCSAIHSTDIVTNVVLSQFIVANAALAGSSATWELHGINWQYYSTNSQGLPGTDKDNWKIFSDFNNLAMTMVLTKSAGNVIYNFTGTTAAKSWINKGGWTHFVGASKDFITGGYGSPTFGVLDSLLGNSYLTVTTTAGGGGSTTSQIGWGFIV